MKRSIKFLAYLCIGVLVFLIITPMLYIIIHSLKGEELIQFVYSTALDNLWEKIFIEPFYVNLSQYYKIFFRTPQFLYLFWNSVIITFPIVFFQTILAIVAAYGFSKVKFPGSETLFFLYIIIMLMPVQVTLVPNYIMLNNLKLLDHYAALILPGAFGTFGTFFLKQFMEGIDKSFIEEAKLLGASDFKIIVYVIIPMCKPIIVSVITLLWIDYWSMIEQPLVFISTKEKYPLSIYLSTIADKNIGIGFACSTLYMILPMFLILYAQNDLTDELKLSSLK